MIENCDESCAYCEFVDRGVDDCYHETYSVSDRCPLYKILEQYREITKHRHSIEWGTGYTGCVHFKSDQKYKKRSYNSISLFGHDEVGETAAQ